LALIAATIVAGFVVRFAQLGLPQSVVKYGGSMLWALMIYWLLSTLFRRQQVLLLALIAGTLATAVEFFKLYHSPAMDAFRLTVPGILLLGRIFSAWDILAYWIAIAIGACIDLFIAQRKARHAAANPQSS
jgi:hypothetical protein